MYKLIKRISDIILAFIGIVLTSPIMLLTAIMIKLETKGPIIFKQERLGIQGKPFWIYKFRSMIVDAEKQGSGQYSYKGDPRVTRIGRVIRLTSIDELPQFFNILKGEMSLIGPRPPLTYHPWRYEEYNKTQKKRFLVKPGITGWAQIHGRKGLTWEERIIYDLYYVDNLSCVLDIKIFFITIYKVLFGKDNINIKPTTKQGK